MTGYEGSRMKLVVDLPKSLVADIRDSVDQGGYEDARDFVETAIENQLELEAERTSDDVITLDEAIDHLDADPQPADDELAAQKTISESSTTQSTPSAQSTPKDQEPTEPTYDEIRPLDPPAENRVSAGPLWGQYNRIFPVKFVIRELALAVTRADQPDEGPWTTSFDAFQTDVAEAARDFGDELMRADERHSRKRGEKFVAGFPTGDDKEKSIDRFQSHFVATLDTNGNISGAPAVLRYINIDPDRREIGLTEAGIAFAALDNPLLDGDFDTETTLSDTERSEYLDHVKATLPAEFEAMQHAARAISSGTNRPTSLTEAVAELDPDWSNAQASTTRSGLVSRMYELGLVTRSRVGQRGIAYELTPTGVEFRNAATNS